MSFIAENPKMAFARGSKGTHRLCLFITRTVTLWFVIQTSVTKGLVQDQYFGCFYDISRPKSNADLSYDNALTIESCIAKCPTTYATIQNGNACRCREDYGAQLPDKSCNLTCSGNSNELCGGLMDQLNAYVVYTACPIGTYGAACDKGCHCQRDVPCDRNAGNCPDGCYGNWSGSACNITAVSQQYIGCYRDFVENRSLGECVFCKTDNYHNNTLEFCSESCAARNYSYAGPEYSVQCFCGENYSRNGPLNETSCNMKCSGTSSGEICGGDRALSVYAVCPVGNYGRSCAGRCNCLNGERCIYRNGSCPRSRCRPGWTGISCSIRDCSKNNGECYINETCSNVTLKFSSISTCRCSDGFQRNKTWENCTDIDECVNGLCDPVSTICSNTVGSFNCPCKIGFQRANATACRPTADDTRKIVGAVVGSILGAALLVALVVLLMILIRRRNRMNDSSQNNGKPVSTDRIQTPIAEVHVYSQQHEPYYNINCSAPTMKELSNALRYKLTTRGVLDKEFKQVPMESKDPSTVGKSREVKKKNRFRNIVSYDKNRVILSKINDVAFSDYINASLIKGYDEDEKLIATQGPLPNTIHDFWRMICEQDVSSIVMITDLLENNKIKCEKYWPDNGKSVAYKEINVKTTKEYAQNGYVCRHFLVTNNAGTFSVTHWHFLSFPDHGIAEDVAKFMAFLKKVRCSKLPEKATVVHCSAGVGRTGTFIAIDYLLQQAKAEKKVDIFGCLQHLRRQRPQMIQNLSQYKFVHQALLFEYTVGDTSMPCAMFTTKFDELRKEDPNTGKSKLETEYQAIEERNQNTSKENKTRFLSKLVDKNRIAEMDVTFVQGWKQKNAYISMALPQTAFVSDLYSLTREFNCSVVIFLDGELGTVDFIFPTIENPLALRSSTVHCDSSSEEIFGTCYKISDIRQSGDTYANVALYANSGAVSSKVEMTVLHVTKSVNSESLDSDALNSMYATLRRLNSGRTESPAVIMSRAGAAVSAFCLAALIAFDMIREDKEVDIFQIVHDLKKSRPQLSFSLPSYTALYAVVGHFINTTSRQEDGTAAHEVVYESIQ